MCTHQEVWKDALPCATTSAILLIELARSEGMAFCKATHLSLHAKTNSSRLRLDEKR